MVAIARWEKSCSGCAELTLPKVLFCDIWEEYSCLMGFQSCSNRGRFVSASYVYWHRNARKHKAAFVILMHLCKYVCVRICLICSVTSQSQWLQNVWYLQVFSPVLMGFFVCFFLSKQSCESSTTVVSDCPSSLYLSIAVVRQKGFWRPFLH